MNDWLSLDRQHCWHPFTQAQTAEAPLPIVRGQGAYLFDDQGKRYLDAISSWWVNLHGHAHPYIANAISAQAHTLEQVMFAGITHPKAVAFAKLLVQHLPAPLAHVFYSDNGSTAVEAALKMACQYWGNQPNPTQRRRFLAFQGGYHGDTFGAMSVGRSSGFYAPFGDWLFAVDFMPYPTQWQGRPSREIEETTDQALGWLAHHLDHHAHETVAFILEPLVQGASGMRMTPATFLERALGMVRACGIPIIFDEVMTGFGRTGTLFATEQVGVVPDILCLSKGITGGFLPLGVTVAQPHIYQAFLSNDVAKALLHGHSYTANPLGCAAALASLELFSTESTLTRIAAISEWQKNYVSELADHPALRQVRYCGTIAALELKTDADYGASVGQWFRQQMAARGVLLRPLGNTLYCLPPYCVTEDDLHFLYQQLRTVLNQWWVEQGSAQPSGLF